MVFLRFRMLAEFMLPDGTHKLQRDWTVFFLNRPGQEGVLADSTREGKPGSTATDSGSFVTLFAFLFCLILFSLGFFFFLCACSSQVPARIFRIDPSTAGSWQPVGNALLNVQLSDPIRILSGTTEILRMFVDLLCVCVCVMCCFMLFVFVWM